MTRTTLRPELESITPPHLRGRPVDHRGYPIPWFAAKPNGTDYDVRIADSQKKLQAVRFKKCWICGDHLGRNISFVIGPMCSVNRLSAEPPQHQCCAIYAAQVCPFLTHPRAERRDAKMPDNVQEHGGVMLVHNPGVCLVWSTRSYTIDKDTHGGVLFRLGDPTELHWFCEGRKATRIEVTDAFEKGVTFLRKIAFDDGPEATEAFETMYSMALMQVPSTIVIDEAIRAVWYCALNEKSDFLAALRAGPKASFTLIFRVRTQPGKDAGDVDWSTGVITNRTEQQCIEATRKGVMVTLVSHTTTNHQQPQVCELLRGRMSLNQFTSEFMKLPFVHVRPDA